MRALKGVFIYIGIVLAIILVIAMALFGFMYFIPSFRILGVGVTHVDKNIKGDTIGFSGYNYNSIQLSISSNKVPIEISASSETNGVDYSLDVSTFGISFDITEYRIIKDIELTSDKVLKIALTVTEPEGLISMSGSGVRVVVPTDKTFAMVLNTKSANITINANDENDVKLSKLSVNTTSGNFYYSRDNEVTKTLSLSDLNLTTTSGTIDLSNINNLIVSSPIKINAERGVFEFANVKSSVDVKGTGITLSADSIETRSEGFSFLAENGKLKVGTLTSSAGVENSIITETAGVYITTLKGKTGIITSSGSIDIEETNHSTVIQSEHGAVSIKSAKDDININTHYGDILVNAYERNGTFVSKRGNIEVNSTSEYNDGYETYIENVNGEITIINRINKLRIETLGSSKVTVTFEKIKSGLAPDKVFEHSIKLNDKGSGKIYLPSGDTTVPAYEFTATGNISGTIKGLNTGDATGSSVTAKDTPQYYPDDSETSKNEAVSSCRFKFHGTIELEGYTLLNQ